MTYKDIIFLQSAEDTETADTILAEEGLDGLLAHLKQWETGEEEIQQCDGVPWGTADEVWRYAGGYVMTINCMLPYYGLVKVVD